MVDSNHVAPPTKKLTFKGQDIYLVQLENGDWMDELGTIYPKVLMDDFNNYCGVGNFTTGKWDPFYKEACFAHDSAFKRLMLKRLLPHESNTTAMLDFSKDIGKVFLQSVYGVVMAPAYFIFGALGGALRWEYLKRKNK